ncbi:MAG: sigma-70 family RNA polymerase sigma factor [Firmicutes bacterium]|nr:sigma-70 family RNA polymerase sigma factor [Bacillota bacterium]
MELESYKKLVNNVVRRALFSFSVPGYAEEDLIHEGYLALYKALQTYDGAKGAKLETYASRCIRNRLIDLARRGGAKLESPSEEVDAAVGEELEAAVERIEMWARLDDALATCTAVEQSIMGMYMRGYGYAEIVEKLDTDKKKIDNTIQKIKRLLTE